MIESHSNRNSIFHYLQTHGRQGAELDVDPQMSAGVPSSLSASFSVVASLGQVLALLCCGKSGPLASRYPSWPLMGPKGHLSLPHPNLT